MHVVSMVLYNLQTTATAANTGNVANTGSTADMVLKLRSGDLPEVVTNQPTEDSELEASTIEVLRAVGFWLATLPLDETDTD